MHDRVLPPAVVFNDAVFMISVEQVAYLMGWGIVSPDGGDTEVAPKFSDAGNGFIDVIFGKQQGLGEPWIIIVIPQCFVAPILGRVSPCPQFTGSICAFIVESAQMGIRGLGAGESNYYFTSGDKLEFGLEPDEMIGRQFSVFITFQVVMEADEYRDRIFHYLNILVD